ncbi:3-beta hydroxysteroid dehydrogenase/isomerase family-domain-containing protein [Cladochytrium replicatum]|nr:3-beta hydroxysteroid dehydrogenase/isomerase family-domain-containing protein [Cladochytrium replicatum]
MSLVWSIVAVSFAVPVLVIALIRALFLVSESLYPVPPVPNDSPTDKGCRAALIPVIPEDTDIVQNGQQTTYAVIGGGGFLGAFVVYRLLRTRKVAKVYVFDLALGSNAWLFEGREEVEFVKMDITKREEVEAVLAKSGAEVVFMTAALIRGQDFLPKDYDRSYRVNVLGTENVLRACEAAPTTKYLVYTSSVAVCLGWDTFKHKKFWDADEGTPYSNQHFGHYGKTKRLAEEMVLSWNGRGFKCVALRPGGIYGYGDKFLFGRLEHSSVAGEYPFNWDYVENVAQSLISSADALKTNPDNVEGRPFFVHDGLIQSHLELVRGYKRLRPEMVPGTPQPLPKIVHFGVSVVGDLLHRVGSTLLEDITISTYNTGAKSMTFSNEAATNAFGDWRRWTPQESIGRSMFLWDLHQSKLDSSKKSN